MFTPEGLRAEGVIPKQPPGMTSHVKRLRAKLAAEREAQRHLSKRERRRLYDENLRKQREGKS